LKNNLEKPNEILFSKPKIINKEERKRKNKVIINDNIEIIRIEEIEEAKNLNMNLNLTKENSSEFFRISDENKEKEKKFNNFFSNFSKNFSNLKQNIYCKNINENEKENYESSSMDINFREFKSFLNNLDSKII